MTRSAAVLILIAGLAPAQGEFQARVDEAIDRGCEALIAGQRPDGSLAGSVGSHALAMLALLHSEIPAEHVAIRKALRPLRRATSGNYEMAVRLMVQEKLREDALWTMAQRDAELLVQHQNSQGSWIYGAASESSFDNSNTQYAILGLRAADEMGLQVPRQAWRRALSHVLGQVSRGGGSGYGGQNPPTCSMTAAAISSLVACRARAGLDAEGRTARRAREAIRAATGFLESHWRPDDPHWTYYTLYGLERAMAFSGQDRLGRKDWYRMGAEWLLGRQETTGHWNGRNTNDTAFALLFLTRASEPTASETPGNLSALMGRLGMQARPREIDEVVSKIVRKGKKCSSLLVHYLEHPQRSVREAAVKALRTLTHKRCDFDPRRSRTKNADAIRRWKEIVAEE